MKRLCLYLTYDKQNIIDRYIGYMLKELKTCVDTLIVICNETEISRGQDILAAYADKIFFRKNIGLDAGGFKDALCNLIGWKEVLKYDTLILINDSFFGPFSPMKEIFETMDSAKVDFWGLSKHAKWISAEEIYFPEHLQSFFIAVQNGMLHSEKFKEYWEEMPYYASYDEVIIKHERVFTEYFSKLGYKYACYADVEANNSEHERNNFNQYFILSYEMVRKRKFPFFKKQQLAYEAMEVYTQESRMQVIDYIDKQTDYDVDLIWENVIRTINPSDLYVNLHLHFILEDKCNLIEERNICIVVYISYENSAEYIQEYLCDFEERYRVVICSSQKKLLEEYQSYSNILLQGRNAYEDMISYLSKFEYVCVIHDADLKSDNAPSYIGKCYFYNRWENLIKNTRHIQSIIELFDNRKWLGFLAPPMPFFNRYFSNIGEEWGGIHARIERQAKLLKIESAIQWNKKSFAVTKSFWIRGSILSRLRNNRSIDYSMLPYIWIYIVQDAGFYSGVVESAEYAGMNIVNLQYTLNVIGDQVRRQYGSFETLEDFSKHVLQGALEVFCKKFDCIYVYGTGAMEKKYRALFPNFEAYIVSDGIEKRMELNGKKVKYLSEIEYGENVGIIVCLNNKNREQVEATLQKKGFLNYICV